MIAAPCCQDKQALGLVTRRQRQWEAQQMGLLLARLAHHLLLGSKQWLSRVPGTGAPTTAPGLRRGTVAPRWLGAPWSEPMAAWGDGQCALQSPPSARNFAPGELFRALSRSCTGGSFALKAGSWKSTFCLSCCKVYVDEWVAHSSRTRS